LSDDLSQLLFKFLFGKAEKFVDQELCKFFKEDQERQFGENNKRFLRISSFIFVIFLLLEAYESKLIE